ncbi:hypothetical protein FN846DRAFT_935250 [Sphaerosporella brunnea]|uniref:Uncharacterized protein n=1 Tax=Sphaerosporella brunnea TaxID=1250544 RepID=A0A5J5F512_9PEZI|nr:hypothetical protein FN846DRAFT_935250 [Sphaerosporella brunnea]
MIRRLFGKAVSEAAKEAPPAQLNAVSKFPSQVGEAAEPSPPEIEVLDLPTLSERFHSMNADWEKVRSVFYSERGTTMALQKRYAVEIRELEKSLMEDALPTLKKLNEQYSSLLGRVAGLESANVKKASAIQVELHSKLLTKLTNRISAVESGKNDNPITRMLMERKDQWDQMGFQSEAQLTRFANDLPKALTIIAPQPDIAMNATVGKIADIYKHLAKEEQKVVAGVFPLIFGKPVEQWDTASPEDKAKSIADWIYVLLWKVVLGKGNNTAGKP